MKKRKRNLWRWADGWIRWYCRKLTEKQRVLVVAMAFILFLTSCLYVIAASLSGFGIPDDHYEIEHIRSPEQVLNKNTNDKNNHLKDYHDDRHPENQEIPGAFPRQTVDTGREA